MVASGAVSGSFFLRSAAVAVLLFFCIIPARAQDWVYHVTGKVFETGKKLEGAVVTLSKNGAEVQRIITKSNGKFDVILEPNNIYILAVGKPGYITKRIEFNMQNVPPERGKEGFGDFIIEEIIIFKKPPNITEEKLNECLGKPIALVAYNPKKEDFDYDMTYANKMADCLKRIKKQQEDAEKEEQRVRDSIANVKNNLLTIENNYNSLITQGDQLFKAGDYAKAKGFYAEASKVKPDQPYPKEQIKLCDEKLGGLLKEKQYTDLIKQADAQFTASNWQGAKDLYLKALEIKQDPYPNEQIKKCDQKLGDLQKYTAAIKKGDDNFATSIWEVSKAGYTEALTYKPGDAYATKKLAEIEQKLKELGDLKDKEEKYKLAIKKGDDNFTKSSWNDAKSAYREALTFKPGDEYATKKLAEVEQKLNDIADKEKKEEEYKKLIAKADGEFNAQQWLDAKADYTTATTLKPTDAYPKQQLLLIEKKLKELGDLKDKEEKYKTAIKKGDDNFGTSTWDIAKQGYSEALTYKPGDDYATKKLAEVNAKLKEIADAKDKEAKYKAAIKIGDDNFGKSLWDASKKGYTDALTYKPGDEYATKKLAEIEQKLKEIADSKDKEAKYKAAIKIGDDNFLKSQWEAAKGGYNDALNYKPGDAYATKKLAEIEQKLKDIADKEQKEQEYKNLIAKADGEFNAQQWLDAKTDYTTATTLKPTDPYPKQQLVLIEKKLKELGDLKDREEKYKVAIKKGDDNFGTSTWDIAKQGYSEALTYKPGDDYATKKLAEVNAKLKEIADAKDKEAKYKAAIKIGDDNFGKSLWDASKKGYTDALTYKPGDDYATKKLAEIEQKLKEIADTKDKEAKYKAAIKIGDDNFLKNQWDASKGGYNDALNYKPGDAYATKKLAEIEQKLKDIADKQKEDEEYKQLIAKADGAFNAQQWIDAKTDYTTALTKRPTDAYPKQQLALIEKKLKEIGDLKDREEKYKVAIKKGDDNFGTSTWDIAKQGYSEALTYKPGDAYATKKLEEVNAKLKEIADAKDKEAKYKAAIKTGDDNFGKNLWDASKKGYNDALTYKPGDEYATKKLAEIEQKLKEIADSKDKEEKYKAAIKIGDDNFNKSQWDAAKGGYNDALNYKPGDAYATKKLGEISDILDKGNKYAVAIKSGDDNFKTMEFNTALTFYKEALLHKPKDPYATKQITECEKGIKLMASYKAAIDKADALFKTQKWQEAITAYNEALKIREDKYPRDQIIECQKQIDLANQNALNEQKYKDAIAKADAKRDEAFKQMTPQPYKDAKVLYQEAMKFKAGDAYASGEITKIDEKLKNLSDPTWINNMFVNAKTRGEVAFSKKDYYGARDAFKEALDYVPGHAYCTQMYNRCLDEIKKLELADANAKKYQDAIKKGDEELANQKYEDAIVSYNEALTYRPKDQYATDKINECELKIKQRDALKQNDVMWQKYNEAMAIAEILFSNKDYSKAKIKYKEASSYQPREQKPKDRIKQCDDLMLNKPVVDTNSIAYKPKDPKEIEKRYKRLRDKYGLGRTELPEVTEANKKILTVVNITETDADVYSRVTWGYGGIFYYKNDIPITEDEFETATRLE